MGIAHQAAARRSPSVVPPPDKCGVIQSEKTGLSPRSVKYERNDERTGCVLVTVFASIVLFVLLVPSRRHHLPATERLQSKNHLKTIGLALHDYHDVYATFPPSAIVKVSSGDTTGADSRPLDSIEQHGWMVMLLPYIDGGFSETDEGLYQRIDFHQPWDSTVNRSVFGRQIETFLHPCHRRDKSYVTQVGEFAAAHYAGNSQLFKPNDGLRIREITDGTSNTLMAGEVSTGFQPWGSPGNVRDPAAGIGKSNSQFAGHSDAGEYAQFLMADGSVRRVKKDIDPEVVANLANPADGNEIDHNSW